MIFDCTERYDPVTKQWAAVASLNFPRCGVGVCSCHGALYALGTLSPGCLSLCFAQERAEYSVTFMFLGVFVLAGGWIGSEIGKTMERYDPAENKWEIIGSMSVPRYYFGCCELQGAIWSFGGRSAMLVLATVLALALASSFLSRPQ